MLAEELDDRPAVAEIEALRERRPRAERSIASLQAAGAAVREIGDRLGDRELLARAGLHLGWRLFLGDAPPDGVLPIADEAREHASHAAPELVREVDRLRAGVLLALGRHEAANEAVRSALEAALPPVLLRVTLVERAQISAALEDRADARRAVHDALAVPLTPAETPSVLAGALGTAGRVALGLDDLGLARRCFLEVLRACPGHEAFAEAHLGYVAWCEGELRPALDHLRRAERAIDQAPGLRGWVEALLGEVSISTGAYSAAVKVLWRASQTWARDGDPLMAIACGWVALRGLWFTATVRRLPDWLWRHPGRSERPGPTPAAVGLATGAVAVGLVGVPLAGWTATGHLWPGLLLDALFLLGLPETVALERVFADRIGATLD